MKKTAVIAGLFKLLKPLLHIMCVTVILGVLGYLAAATITVCGIMLILTATGEISVSVRVTITIMTASAVLRAFLRYFEQKSGHYIAFRELAVIRDKVYGALRRLAPAKLEGRGRGDLCSMVTGDVEQLEVFYAHTVAPVATAVIVSAAAFAFIAAHSAWSAVIAAAAYLTVGVIIPIVTAKSGAGKASRERLAELNDCFLESLRGIDVSLRFGTIEKRRKKTAEKTCELLKEQRAIKRHEGLSSALSGAAVTIFTAAAFVAGIIGGTEFADSLIVAAVLSATFGPVIALSNLSAALTQTFASGERVLALLDEEPAVSENTDGTEPEFDGIECDNVTFGYGEEIVLENFSFNAKNAGIYGIMGHSGCGKSTVMRLMMRFWDCKQGAVRISDENIENIRSRHLTKIESFMTQTTDLFTGSVRDNIKIAAPNADNGAVENACRMAAIHDFIMSLPNGYDTAVAELGENFSSGERQRLGLARAFLHGSPLMLLDEPTANLDAMNEGVILRSVKSCKNKTIVISSHRRSTMSICGDILDMDARGE